MTPRHPPESPDDDVQSENLQSVHDALSDITPVNDPAEAQPATETQQDARPAEAPDETEVDIDRIEAYLRGPTAFTA
jgi:hypothetical protein